MRTRRLFSTVPWSGPGAHKKTAARPIIIRSVVMQRIASVLWKQMRASTHTFRGFRALTESGQRHSTKITGLKLYWPMTIGPTTIRSAGSAESICWTAISQRAFATASVHPIIPDSIQIIYATQTGTAQLFATDLSDALVQQREQDGGSATVSIHPIHEVADLTPDNSILYLFLASTAGIGEFPDHARVWMDQLDKHILKSSAFSDQYIKSEGTSRANENHLPTSTIRYAIFALGHSQAHPHHFGAAGKKLDEALQAAGATPVLPLCLGDDAGSLEDDFDDWTSQVLQLVTPKTMRLDQHDSDEKEGMSVIEDSTSKVTQAASTKPISFERSPRGPSTLKLVPSMGQSYMAQTDLLDSRPDLYPKGSQRFVVLANGPLRSDIPSATGLWEMRLGPINPRDKSSVNYNTGDHLVVLPCNSDTAVDAHLAILGPQFAGGLNADHYHSVIQSLQMPEVPATRSQRKLYEGLSVKDTLTHCYDLSGSPSPAVARWLTGTTRKNIEGTDYGESSITVPRKSVLELLRASADSQASPDQMISLEDLLWSLPNVQPRYYSIASSSEVHPDKIYLTYRPVEYYHPSFGTLKQGLCTRHLKSKPIGSTLVAAVRSNPSFSLPPLDKGRDGKMVPIIFVAGGCGVAPIRAFLEELIHRAKDATLYSSSAGPNVHLFLGFRHPGDKVYADLIEEADNLGILASRHVSFMAGCAEDNCATVSEVLMQHGEVIFPALEIGHTYVCGGARLFGAAIEGAVLKVLQDQKGQCLSEAQETLKTMMDEGRFHEDLSD